MRYILLVIAIPFLVSGIMRLIMAMVTAQLGESEVCATLVGEGTGLLFIGSLLMWWFVSMNRRHHRLARRRR